MLPRKEENLLTIVDMMGRTVVQMTIANGTTIDINHLSDGVYTIIITIILVNGLISFLLRNR